MRHVEDVSALFDSAASEALFAFGDASLLIERLVERPRHIEIQIFGDRFGERERENRRRKYSFFLLDFFVQIR